MITVEDRARKYAESCDKLGAICGREALKSIVEVAFIAGAKEALGSQWRKPEEEMPKDGDLILIREYYRSAKSGKYVNHVREFFFFEKYGFELEEKINDHLGYRITHWMPIPNI